MSAQSNVVGRFLLSLGPVGIVVGYILALFVVVAGAATNPFSSIWLVDRRPRFDMDFGTRLMG